MNYEICKTANRELTIDDKCWCPPTAPGFDHFHRRSRHERRAAKAEAYPQEHVTEREKQDVFPAGPRGRTHAFGGRTSMYALGLRKAWKAQRNGFTPIRNVSLRVGRGFIARCLLARGEVAIVRGSDELKP